MIGRFANSFVVDGNATNSTNVTDTSENAVEHPLKLASEIIIAAGLVIIMLGMGSAISLREVIDHLKRPTGIAIGMLSQFVVFPLLTFGLAHALHLEPLSAIGMLIIACCPGGSASNVFTYWVEGDVPLSLAMTSVSTLMALGMMPLNLFIYSKSWTEKSIDVPYVNIIISLMLTIVPSAVGMLVKWKWPKAATFIVKCGSAAGVVAVILILSLFSYMYPFIYQSSWRVYLAAFLLPFIGFVFGYFVTFIFRMDHKHCRTVAMETGIQNFALCMTVISLTFSANVLAEVALIPLLYAVFGLVNLCILSSIYKAISYYRKTGKKKITKISITDVNGKKIEENVVSDASVY